MSLTILAIGSAGWKSPVPIETLFDLIQHVHNPAPAWEITVVTRGDTKADRMIGSIATAHGWTVIEETNPVWTEPGSGRARDTRIFEDYNIDYVVVFHILPISISVADVIKQAQEYDVKVLRIPAL